GASAQDAARAYQAFPYDLRPASRRRPEVHDHVAGFEQVFRFHELQQFEGRTCAVPFLLSEFYVGIVQMLSHPVFRRFILCQVFLPFQPYSRTIRSTMPILELESKFRSALRAAAHPLRPVVQIGDKGLSDAVIQEIDRALTAHGLIKVRAGGDDRAAREAVQASICESLNCAPVHLLGKVLVLYRPTESD